MARVDPEVAEVWGSSNPPEDDVNNQPWRDTLLTLGHDPTRPDSPRGPDAEV
jgi:hypothetical protein